MAENSIEFIVKLRGGPEAAADARRVEQAVSGVGGKMKAVGDESERQSRRVGAFGGSLKKLAIGLGAVGAGYMAWNQAKGAIKFTEELGVHATTFAKATGLSVGKASALVAVSSALGIESTKLGMVFAKLGKATIAQAEATGKHVTAFDRLGISQAEAKAHLNDTAGMLDLVTHKLATEHIPAAEKATLMTELFGRSWQSLGPLLLEGEVGFSKLTKMAKEFGLELGGNSAEQLHKFHMQQVESKLAMEGLQVSFTKLLAGPLGGVLSGFAKLTVFARAGQWNAFNKEVGRIAQSFEVLAEKVVPHVAEAFAHVAPAVLKAFWKGFVNAPLGTEAVLGLVLATKLGLTKAVFAGVGSMLLKAMTGKLLGTAAMGAVGEGGAALGTAFGLAFQAAAAVAIVALAAYIGKLLGEALSPATTEDRNNAGKHLSKEEVEAKEAREKKHLAALNAHKPWHENAEEKMDTEQLHRYMKAHHKPIPHAASGASVVRPGILEVGERGPELVHLPAGAGVTPMKPGSLADSRPIVLKVNGRVLGELNRRELLEAQAAGAT